MISLSESGYSITSYPIDERRSRYVQVESVWLYNWWAPVSPASKNMMSPAVISVSPSGVLNDADPEIII